MSCDIITIAPSYDDVQVAASSCRILLGRMMSHHSNLCDVTADTGYGYWVKLRAVPPAGRSFIPDKELGSS